MASVIDVQRRSSLAKPEVTTRSLEDAEEIADLVNEVWHMQYPDNSLLPQWPAEFFDWQFLRAGPEHDAVCMGVFIGGAPVGVYCGDCWSIRFGGHEDRATLLSCVSVRSDARHPAVAASALASMREWSEHHDSHYFFGYVNPDGVEGVGRRYWTTRRGYRSVFLRHPRLWQLDPERSPLCSGGFPPSAPVDLDVAARQVRQLLDAHRADEAILFDWPAKRLTQQLRYGDIAHTVGGRSRDDGICSYYILPTRDGASLAYIDFLTFAADAPERAAPVLGEALARMREQHCRRVFIQGEPLHGPALLKRLGFVPCFPSYTPLMLAWDEHVPLPSGDDAALVIYR